MGRRWGTTATSVDTPPSVLPCCPPAVLSNVSLSLQAFILTPWRSRLPPSVCIASMPTTARSGRKPRPLLSLTCPPAVPHLSLTCPPVARCPPGVQNWRSGLWWRDSFCPAGSTLRDSDTPSVGRVSVSVSCLLMSRPDQNQDRYRSICVSGSASRVLATGGASANRQILQVGSPGSARGSGVQMDPVLTAEVLVLFRFCPTSSTLRFTPSTCRTPPA